MARLRRSCVGLGLRVGRCRHVFVGGRLQSPIFEVHGVVDDTTRRLLLILFLLHLFDFGEDLCRRFVDALAAVVEFFLESGAALAENFKSKDEGLVRQRSVLWIEVWVRFEQDVCKADPKVGPIDV